MTALRFAPLIRVSTEKGPEEKRQSLLDQTEHIKQYVKFIGGTIPDNCWEYCGQEHATPEYERAKLDQLLKDCTKDKFDAVMVYDASRWSRDNLKHEQGIRIFRQHGIRFFIGTIEMNLFDPNAETMLSMQVLLAQHQAKIQKLKSITSRISRAKRGIPSTGKLPYGRTFDKKTETWSINEEQAKKVRFAADRYLAGEPIHKIAKSLGVSVSLLWKVFHKRAGDVWPVRFCAKELNVDESIEIKIPRLLNDATIKALKVQALAKKTYGYGETKHKYLLSSMIFCNTCGHAMSGQANRWAKRYYTHNSVDRAPVSCQMKKYIPADLIENAVLIHLVQTLGDVEKIKQAVERATPDTAKVKKLIEEQDNLQGELSKIPGQRDRVVAKVMDGLISDEDIKSQMGKLKEREASIQERLAVIEAQLEGIPDPARVEGLSKLSIAVLADATRNPHGIFKRTYDWKRHLVEHAFGGRDAKGGRLGVYIGETGDPRQPWQFEIRGVLESTLLALPLDDEYLEDTFKLDPEYQDIEVELREIRDHLKGQGTWGRLDNTWLWPRTLRCRRRR